MFNWIIYNFLPHLQKIKNIKPEKILIIRNDHLGDLCVSLPFINSIKKVFPDTETHLLVNEYAFDLVSGNKNIDCIIIQKKSDGIPEILNKITDKYDILFNLCSTSFNARLSRKIAAAFKIGYAYKLYNIFSFNRYVFTHRKNPPIHECDFCFEYLNIFNIDISSIKNSIIKNTVIHIDGDTENFIHSYKKKLGFISSKKIIGIHPGDSKSAFNWSLKKYIELADHLSQKYEIVFIFGPAEKDLINHFTNVQKNKFRFVRGDLSVKQLVCFIKNIDCLVSGSTGPMHIAGLTGVPTVSIFSNKPSHSQHKWHPLNNKYLTVEPRMKYSKSSDNRSLMDSIPVTEVSSLVDSIFCNSAS